MKRERYHIDSIKNIIIKLSWSYEFDWILNGALTKALCQYILKYLCTNVFVKYVIIYCYLVVNL